MENTSLDRLNTLEGEALAALATIGDSDALLAWQGKYFGTKRNKGELELAMSALGSLSKEERPAFGKRANEVMTVVARALSDRDIDDLAAWYGSIRIEAKPPD